MAHRISHDRFKALPNARDVQVLNGVPMVMDITDGEGRTTGAYTIRRWKWVYTCALQIIGAMSPGARWLLLRDGFYHFQNVLIPAFNMSSPLPLRWYEVRAVWDAIAEYQRRYESHLLPGLELLHQRELRSSSSDVPTYAESIREVVDDNPEVDAIRDGSLRRVR
jgi:hypothetical protein